MDMICINIPNHNLFIQDNLCPLHYASIKGNSDIVDMLLTHGANGDVQDKVLIYS